MNFNEAIQQMEQGNKVRIKGYEYMALHLNGDIICYGDEHRNAELPLWQLKSTEWEIVVKDKDWCLKCHTKINQFGELVKEYRPQDVQYNHRDVKKCRDLIVNKIKIIDGKYKSISSARTAELLEAVNKTFGDL